MNLSLESFGSCRFVSGHHATIFYDEMSKHFELLNYSEHGTVVDNIVYCCDVSIPASSKRLDDSKDDSDEGTSAKDKTNILFNGLDDLLRRNSDADKTNTYENLFTDPHDQGSRCGCLISNAAISKVTNASGTNSAGGAGGSGWEGTALLTHGSHIKFGCLQFILCVSNTNEKPRFIHHR